jgi:hypothetical protein
LQLKDLKEWWALTSTASGQVRGQGAAKGRTGANTPTGMGRTPFTEVEEDDRGG